MYISSSTTASSSIFFPQSIATDKNENKNSSTSQSQQFQDTFTNEISNKYVYGENGVLKDDLLFADIRTDLNLSDAHTYRLENEGSFKHYVDDFTGWSQENIDLYKKLESEYLEADKAMLDSGRDVAMVEKSNEAFTKLMIVATYGKSHEITESSLNEAVASHNEVLDKQTISSQGLSSFAYSQNKTEEEIKEELEKVKEEFIARLSNSTQSQLVNQKLNDEASQLSDKLREEQENPQPLSEQEKRNLNLGIREYQRISSYR